MMSVLLHLAGVNRRSEWSANGGEDEGASDIAHEQNAQQKGRRDKQGCQDEDPSGDIAAG